jgi:hypothetical protein
MTSDSAGRDLCAAGWQSEFKLDGFCNCRAPATCSAFTGAGPKLTTRRSCVVSSRSSKTSHRMRPAGNACSGEVAIGARAASSAAGSRPVASASVPPIRQRGNRDRQSYRGTSSPTVRSPDFTGRFRRRANRFRGDLLQVAAASACQQPQAPSVLHAQSSHYPVQQIEK